MNHVCAMVQSVGECGGSACAIQANMGAQIPKMIDYLDVGAVCVPPDGSKVRSCDGTC